VALVAQSRRELLLRVHRHRLRREDLEDCYSQATLELVAHVRGGAGYEGRAHIGAAIEQRFLSRVQDRRRALSGRSPMQAALEGALPLTGPGGEEVNVIDARADLERLVILRQELRRIGVLSRRLTQDQRLILCCQVSLQMKPSEFCRRFGWSAEKYRKVGQRARAHLRSLIAIESDVPGAGERSEERAGTAYESHSPHP
jgi:DNA-directed RNA polymerase specialized sigma24 family protein